MAVQGQQLAWVSFSATAMNGKQTLIPRHVCLLTYGMPSERNVSERLQGKPQTNQRAELTAVIRALELTKEDEKVRIYTDSRYSIDCSINWYKAWVRNGWKKPNGELVLNQDLVKQIRALIDERDEAGLQTGFQWVKGHSTNSGNVAADRLAVAGAKKQR
ncbi:ribonuclease H-like domain-containing protein [Xylaria intraflava]|nr:ribonuclease H-like domain-containing protein [Xylaria intraflava]